MSANEGGDRRMRGGTLVTIDWVKALLTVAEALMERPTTVA